MNELEGLDWQTLLEDDGLILSRSRTERLLVMAATSASADTAQRLEQYYSLRQDLDPAWALCPTAHQHWQGLPVLVADDPGGQPLVTLLDGPLELASFL